MKTAIRVALLVVAAVSLLSACATPGTQVALADDEEFRCTRYGMLWDRTLGHCMHPGSR